MIGPRLGDLGFFIEMTTDEQMAIVVEVMEDRSIPNRPSSRIKRMKELGLTLSHAEMMSLWQRYRYEATRKRYVGYVPFER